jgi:hypothetical protein
MANTTTFDSFLLRKTSCVQDSSEQDDYGEKLTMVQKAETLNLERARHGLTPVEPLPAKTEALPTQQNT